MLINRAGKVADRKSDYIAASPTQRGKSGRECAVSRGNHSQTRACEQNPKFRKFSRFVSWTQTTSLKYLKTHLILHKPNLLIVITK